MSRRTLTTIGIACLLGLLAPGAPTAWALAPLDEPRDFAWREDAPLYDVCAVGERAWAVGGCGVIWHSDDAGKSWTQQSSGTAAALTSVCFVDAEHGWAAGGIFSEHARGSRGVLLQTDDGGAHWRRAPGIALPRIVQLRMFSAGSGWCLSDPCPLNANGLWRTSDGGRDWTPLPGEPPMTPVRADFPAPDQGLLLGDDGRRAQYDRGRWVSLPRGLPPLAAWRGGDLNRDGAGAMVGDRGAAALTADFGQSWQAVPALAAPTTTTQAISFQAVAVRGPRIWAAGSPGDVLAASDDGGRSWRRVPTGGSSPIAALAFAGERLGYAVGEGGAISVTRDAGQSWQAVRPGAAAGGLLVIAARAREIPWNLVATHAGDEGRRTALVVVGREDLDALDPLPPARLAQAAAATGASSCHWENEFPLRRSELQLDRAAVLEAWQAVHDDPQQALRQCLAAHVQRHRPAVVVIPSLQASDAATRLIAEAALSAVQTVSEEPATAGAADPARVVALPHVQRVATIGPANPAAVVYAAGRLLPRLGVDAAELADEAAALVDPGRIAPAGDVAAYLLVDHSGRNAPADLFAGVRLSPTATRATTSAARADLAATHRGQQTRRLAEELFERAQRSPSAAKQLIDAAQLARQLQPNEAARLLRRLAARLHAAGRSDLAAELQQQLVRDQPGSDAAAAAAAWLVNWNASAEALTAERMHARSTGGAAALAARGAAADAAAKVLQAQDPLMHCEPGVRLPLWSIERRLRPGRPPTQSLHSLRTAPRGAAAVQKELALQGEAVAQRLAHACAAAERRPRLDGALDDACWTAAAPLPLVSPDGDDAQRPAEVRFAADQQFLYLAVRCTRSAGAVAAPAVEVRPRDADLTKFDRVRIWLDTDRDWTSGFELSIDERGCTADALECGGRSAAWNPQWFVAAGGADAQTPHDVWTAEAAIAWNQLCDAPPGPGEVWAVGAERLIPGLGVQHTAGPAERGIGPLNAVLLRLPDEPAK